MFVFHKYIIWVKMAAQTEPCMGFSNFKSKTSMLSLRLYYAIWFFKKRFLWKYTENLVTDKSSWRFMLQCTEVCMVIVKSHSMFHVGFFLMKCLKIKQVKLAVTTRRVIFFLFCPQDSSEIHFKVKMTTHLKKLKESYCQRQVCATMTFFKKKIKT